MCADKFQTGYDEPLLHTMYVDKPLSGIKAVQTLSRLNRAHPKKHDAFVLDFMNEAEAIEAAFAPYYRATALAGETDPNKLHDLQAALDGAGVYGPEELERVVELVLGGARTYGFLGAILPYTNAAWEKRSILLSLLVPKLPAPVEEDLSRGILEAIDMDSYRVEKRAAMKLQLPDAEGALEPVPTGAAGGSPSPSWTGCRTSSRTSTTSSGPCSPTRTG